jgi:hypothetical protein
VPDVVGLAAAAEVAEAVVEAVVIAVGNHVAGGPLAEAEEDDPVCPGRVRPPIPAQGHTQVPALPRRPKKAQRPTAVGGQDLALTGGKVVRELGHRPHPERGDVRSAVGPEGRRGQPFGPPFIEAELHTIV